MDHLVVANVLDGIYDNDVGTKTYIAQGVLVSDALDPNASAAVMFANGGSYGIVEGAVYGTMIGVNIATPGGGEVSSWTIGTSGSVTEFWGGIAMYDRVNDLSNYGYIAGNSLTGAYFNGEENTCVNGGTITGFDAGVGFRSHHGDVSTLTNTGEISGAASVFGEDGVEHVINAGQLAGNVSLYAGDDIVDNAAGTIIGSVNLGEGNDTFLGGLGFVSVAVNGEDGNDFLAGGVNADLMSGGNGNDRIFGGGGDDLLYGGSGNDVLAGGAGVDLLYGGGGYDTASYAASPMGVVIALDGSLVASGDAAFDTLTLIENLEGTKEADTLYGDDGNNGLKGFGGADILNGQAGKDALWGGIGRDVLTGGLAADGLSGGAGNDIFVFDSPDDGGDTITDFSPKAAGDNDSLQFDGDAFGGLAMGDIPANAFTANLSGNATGTAQRFIYETDTGILRFDVDGNGSQGSIVIATFQGMPTLTVADFMIV